MLTMPHDLRDTPGSIWVMIKLDDEQWFHEAADRQLIDDLVALVIDHAFGEVDGHSSGAGAMDVNFVVVNQRRTATAIDHYLRHTHPELTYCINDRYLPLFEDGAS